MSLICLKNKQMDALKNAKKLHSVHAETRKQLGYVQNSETDIDILVDKLKSWIKMVEIGYNKYTGFFIKYEDAVS